MKVLIWTRSRSDWQDDAPRIHSMLADPEVQIEHIPCIQLEPISYDFGGERAFDVAIITSANVLRFAGETLKTALKHCPRIYTHGAKTAVLAQSQGLSQIQTIAARTAAELIQQLLPLLADHSRVLLPSAEQPATDLAQTLMSIGCEVVAIPVYRTLSAARCNNGAILQRSDIELARSNWSGVVCFASPSAVHAFADTYAPQSNRLRDSLIAIAIGPSTAAACQGHFKQIIQASGNSIEDLLMAASRTASSK